MLKTATISLFCILLLHTAQAFDPEDPETWPQAGDSDRKVIFSYIGPPVMELRQELFYLYDGEPVAVHSTFQARGPAQPLAEEEELILGRMVKVERNGVEEEVFRPIASVPLNPQEDNFWAILYPVRNEGGVELSAFVYEDGLQKHPKDHIKIHNLTPFPMRGQLSGSLFELEPREDAMFSYDPENDTHAVFEIYLYIDGDWIRSYMTSRPIRENRRMNLFTMMRPDDAVTQGRSAMLITFIDHL